MAHEQQPSFAAEPRHRVERLCAIEAARERLCTASAARSSSFQLLSGDLGGLARAHLWAEEDRLEALPIRASAMPAIRACCSPRAVKRRWESSRVPCGSASA